jgi:ABC-2 type transport system permease protein
MRLVGAELMKVVTAYRTFLGLVLAELGIVLLGTIVTVRDAANDPFLSPRFEQDLVSIGATSLFFVTLLGVLIATSEYRHGTITLTFLSTPVREKVLAAKTATALFGSALLVAPALLISVGIGILWLSDRPDFSFGGDEWQLVGRLFLGAMMVSVFGLFIGSALKRQLGAIILVLGWLFFAEPAIGGLFPGTEDYLVGTSVNGVLGGDDTAPSFGHSLPVLTAYLVALGVLATVLTRRRDIT